MKNNSAVPTRLFKMGDVLATLFFFIAVFLILTDGIPLAQWGMLHVQFTKKICLPTSRYSILALFSVFGVWAWRWPDPFRRLGVTRLAQSLCRMPLWIPLCLLFFAYFLTEIAVGFMRHWAMETMAFDLGIFAQAVWNTLQGDFLYSSLKGGICLLGDHVSPILALLAPLYRLWPDPKNLLVLQAFTAAACIFPIGYLAKQKTRSTFVALVFVLAYYFFLPTRNALREDFHPEMLIEIFLLLAFILLEKKRMLLFLCSLFVALLAKENMLGVVFAFGFYMFAWKRQKIGGLALMATAVLFFMLYTRWLVPFFSGTAYFYGRNYQHLFSGVLFGSSEAGLHWKSLGYVLNVFLPFLFLPFCHLPTLFLTFPILTQNLLSANPLMRSLGYHYSAGMTPFLFISSIYGFAALCQKQPWLAKRKHFLAVLLLFAALLRSGASEYFYFTQSLSHRSAHKDMIRAKLARVPANASVLTHNNLIPQLANRKEIFQFDYGMTPTKPELARKLKADFVALDREFMEPNTEAPEIVLKDLRELGYAVDFERDGFYLLKKQGTEPGPAQRSDKPR